MSKNGLILTSLVGAIPGALMTYMMVMAFVNFAGGASPVHKALCGLALLIGLLLAAMPIGVLVLAGPKAEKPAKSDSGKKKNSDASDEAVEEAEDAVAETGNFIAASGSGTPKEIKTGAASPVSILIGPLTWVDEGSMVKFAMPLMPATCPSSVSPVEACGSLFT